MDTLSVIQYVYRIGQQKGQSMIHRTYEPSTERGVVLVERTRAGVPGYWDEWETPIGNRTHLALVYELGGRVTEAWQSTPRAGALWWAMDAAKRDLDLDQEREKVAAVLEQMSLAAVAAATKSSDALVRELAGEELLSRVHG
jgi:hypothetical protein